MTLKCLAVTEVDPAAGTIVKKVHFDASHVEAMAIEQHGDRLYVNVSDKNAIAVVDKNKGAIAASPGEATTGGAVLRYDVTPRVAP